MLVPTMGALHEGHASLIRLGVGLARARGLPGGCVVSIFVNPTQFNDRADFTRYPRTLDDDAALCDRAGAAAVFAPTEARVYPDAAAAPVPPLPPVATEPGLEDAHRPGHFAGVCQVVHRLFALVRPALAVFGEKDWQQLQVVRAMVAHAARHDPKDPAGSVEIVPAPTVREAGGLAMSSRNRFLSDDQRTRGLAISRALAAAGGSRTPAEAERAARDVLARARIEADYAVVRDAETLSGPPRDRRPGRCLIAVRVGSVRLIDNMAWPSIS